eukprot:8091485-Karenia_brevis.AAC.1
MKEHALYVLAVSEIRMDGQGELDVGDGFVLLYNGNGPTGGVGILLSPDAATSWRDDGCRTRAHPGRRTIACSL